MHPENPDAGKEPVVMAKYYLLMDYLTPSFTDMDGLSIGMTGPLSGSMANKRKFYKRSSYASLPKTRRILEVEPGLILYVAVFDIDVGHYVIKATSRKKAYDVATMIRTFFSLFFGMQPDERSGHYFLQELSRLPRPNWNDKRLFEELETDNFTLVNGRVGELHSGEVVNYEAFIDVLSFIKAAWGNVHIIESLNHLLESRFLFCGFMLGSFYACHYSRERPMIPKWEMEKRYFEDRLRYETAFLAAFKGIERFFAVNDIKKQKMDEMFEKCNYHDITPNTLYTRYHEIFSGHKKEVTYRELIEHFLQLRNVVAAHGNKRPPDNTIIIEDSVYEIQLFLLGLLSKAIYGEQNTRPVWQLKHSHGNQKDVKR